jgi:hypothetical protein
MKHLQKYLALKGITARQIEQATGLGYQARTSRRIRRGSITYHGQIYQSPKLVLFEGCVAVVHLDPYDPSRLVLYGFDGCFYGVAERVHN